MSSNTENLKLFKYDTITDKDQTFNINLALNDNWDKLDLIIGILSTLPTDAKGSIIAALTETYNKIPTKVSQLTNDSGYLAKVTCQDIGAAPATHGHTAGQISGLSTVATTGKYSDLIGAPSLLSQLGNDLGYARTYTTVYIGDGQAERFINLGVTPKYAILSLNGNTEVNYAGTCIQGYPLYDYSTTIKFMEIVTNGIKIYYFVGNLAGSNYPNKQFYLIYGV